MDIRPRSNLNGPIDLVASRLSLVTSLLFEGRPSVCCILVSVVDFGCSYQLFKNNPTDDPLILRDNFKVSKLANVFAFSLPGLGRRCL